MPSDVEGPEDGHTFRISVISRMSSTVVGDPVHKDAPDFMGEPLTVDVRAWNIVDAMTKAAALPFRAWFPEETE